MSSFDPLIVASAPDPLLGTEADCSIYRNKPIYVHSDVIEIEALTGRIDNQITSRYQIAYTQMGLEGPPILFLHGVPTNRRQYYPVQRRLAPFCRTVSIDMLGMGESSKPKDYGTNSSKTAWFWANDVEYIEKVAQELFGQEPFFFFADDWGGGILFHYAARYSSRLRGAIFLDPVALDGYPVNEIQAFGRASLLDEADFQRAMGDVDAKMIQILKSMVFDNSKFNQYSYRKLLFPYVDTDYEKPGASSLNMNINFPSLRILCDRAAVLSPDQLLPYDSERNPDGVAYDQITCPVHIMWGAQDNMMPSNQIYRFPYLCLNTTVTWQKIENAGHFAAIDQPTAVAENTLMFISSIASPFALADVFLGFDGIWKGDERAVRSEILPTLHPAQR